ncbi:MAG: methionyl-tRNA formyltransferase [Clostridiales Family XIII bacterium]|nr:methionyl-tRNA formyltransferase [Clostridiales Family XIII bacterium]
MANGDVKIVYMGTPDFALPALSALVHEDWNVSLVVTQPDRPRGRGKSVTPSPVKLRASELCLPIAQPDRIKDNAEFVNLITDLHPDLIVVAAYGKILPRELLDIPRFGCVNIHASLLPKYRGAAPIHRAVEAGETETGVTLMYMAEELDAGDIIAAARIDIAGMNTGQVHDLLAPLGAKLLTDTLPAIVAGTAPRVTQDHDAATYAPMVRKEEGHIDFNAPACVIGNKIRAMNPAPGAYAFLDDMQMKIVRARVCEDAPNAETAPKPGTLLCVSQDGITVAARDGVVILDVIQAPGKKPLRVSEYLKGNAIDLGGVFR